MSGFSFSATSATGSKPAGTGFSFGSTSTSGTGNSGAKPAAPAFSFGGQSTTGANAADKAQETIELPEEIKDMTVKDFLETCEQQLKKDAELFRKRAEETARRDRLIYDCVGLMQHLEQQIKTVEGRQKELAQSAASLLEDQEKFIKELGSARQKNTASRQTDDQRGRLYKLAHNLGERFLTMENDLRQVVEQAEGPDDESETDVGKIVKVANYHLESLRWLETQCQALEAEIEQIDKKMTTRH